MLEPALCVVRRADTGYVLLGGGARPELPRVAAPVIWFPAAVEHVARAAEVLLDSPVHVLHLLLEDEPRLWQLEALEPKAVPAILRWAPAAEMARVRSPTARHRAALRSLAAAPSGSRRREAPWQRAGWHRSARAWIAGRAVDLGAEAAPRVADVRGAWPGSCVLRVSAGAETLYFKATLPDMPPESQLLRWLAASWAEHLPEVVAELPEQGWMLMRELPAIGSAALAPEDYDAACELLARIQISTVGRLDSPALAALPAWSLETLAEELRTATEEATGWGLWPSEAPGGADPAPGPFVRQLESDVHRLLELGIPETLIHADFHPGNVARRDGRIVLFDWGEARRGHPFFSATRFLDYLAADAAVGVSSSRLREAYLAPWREQLPAARLEEAFEIALRLHPARQAVRWHQARRSSEPGSPWRELVEAAFVDRLSSCLEDLTPGRGAS